MLCYVAKGFVLFDSCLLVVLKLHKGVIIICPRYCILDNSQQKQCDRTFISLLCGDLVSVRLCLSAQSQPAAVTHKALITLLIISAESALGVAMLLHFMSEDITKERVGVLTC